MAFLDSLSIPKGPPAGFGPGLLPGSYPTPGWCICR